MQFHFDPVCMSPIFTEITILTSYLVITISCHHPQCPQLPRRSAAMGPPQPGRPRCATADAPVLGGEISDEGMIWDDQLDWIRRQRLSIEKQVWWEVALHSLALFTHQRRFRMVLAVRRHMLSKYGISYDLPKLECIWMYLTYQTYHILYAYTIYILNASITYDLCMYVCMYVYIHMYIYICLGTGIHCV